jgi:hypothetical protein
MVKPASLDLPVIQKTYDLIRWYVPILNRLPRDHRFTLGVSRMGTLCFAHPTTFQLREVRWGVENRYN